MTLLNAKSYFLLFCTLGKQHPNSTLYDPVNMTFLDFHIYMRWYNSSLYPSHLSIASILLMWFKRQSYLLCLNTIPLYVCIYIHVCIHKYYWKLTICSYINTLDQYTCPGYWGFCYSKHKNRDNSLRYSFDFFEIIYTSMGITDACVPLCQCWEPGSSARAASIFKCWAISPASNNTTFLHSVKTLLSL